MEPVARQTLVEQNHPRLSLKTQCQLLGISRSSLYYEKVSLLDKYHGQVKAIDRLYTDCPFYGARKMSRELKKIGLALCRETVGKLMGLMGIEALRPKRNLSKANPENLKFPYLLRNLEIAEPGQVWSMDITYIPLPNGQGHAYLAAVIDWNSRYVLAWRLSNTLDTGFCLECLQEALTKGCPLFFNTDQGAQFTSDRFITAIVGKGISFSMDGRGRSLDNVFVERLWWSVKYEDVYLKGYEDMTSLYAGLTRYFEFYNNRRTHASLDYKTPKEVHYEKRDLVKAAA
jgi:putative transposase